MAYLDVVNADAPVRYTRFEGNVTPTGTRAGGWSGAPTSYVTGVAGQAGYFNGSASLERTGDSTGAYFTGTVGTIEAWVKTTATSGVIAAVGSTANSNYFFLQMESTGKVTFRRQGTGTFSISTSVINDGNWHYVAGVHDNGNLNLYVDGTLHQSSYGYVGTDPANGNVFVAKSGTGAQFFTGSIDELAIYNKAITATDASEHYAAGASTSITVDVPTVTATAHAVPAVVAQVSVTVDTVRATAQAHAVTQETVFNPSGLQAISTSITEDYTWTGAKQNITSPNVIFTSGAGASQAIYRINPVTTDMALWLGFTFVVSGSNAITVRTVLNDANTAFGETISVTGSTSPQTKYVQVPAGQSVYGFSIQSTGGTTYYFSEDSSGKAPQVSRYSIPTVAVDVNVPTVTASATVNAVQVSSNVAVDVPTTTATASAGAGQASGSVEVSVETVRADSRAYDVTIDAVVTPDADITVATVYAFAQAHDVTVSLPVEILVDTVRASATVHEATQETAQNALAEVETARATATVVRLTDVNGEPIVPTEDEDPFFNSTMFLNPTVWFRMNITSGTTELPRVGSANFSGQYTDATIGLNGGPNGRKYVHFNGTSMFNQLEANDEGYDYNGTLEFAIRTDKKSQFVMRMDDYLQGLGGNSNTPSRDLYLVDGKLQYRVWSGGNPVNATVFNAFTGTTDLADGEWHHVVLASSLESGTVQYPTTGKVDVYIDGKLELRRQTYGFSFPDYIGGRPGFSWNEYLAIPQSEWFVGDLTEVAFFNRAHFNLDQVLRQNDTLFGYDPVYVQTARAFAKVNDIAVKTNAKRILTINMAPTTRTLYMSGAPIGFTFAGLAYAGSSNRNAVKVGDYQVFQYSLFKPDNAPYFLDEVTDEQRLLDLEKDVNLDDYDVINLINFPQSSNDWTYYENWDRSALFGGLNGRQQVEKLLGQVKQFVVDGGGLFVTDPSLAAYLNIVDRVEYVPHMREPKKAYDTVQSLSRSRDLRAAKINPWGTVPNGAITTIWEPRATPGLQPGVDYDELANYYDDEHSNNAQRVRKLVSGLTDLPGSILVDSISFFPASQTGEMHAEKWDERPDGLQVGDEFRLMGTPHSGRGGGWNGSGYAGEPVSTFMRYYGTVATPIANVKAGTVVTSFGAKTWQEDNLTDNPYKDYAVSIIIEPGDSWSGQTIQGRVFVNFSEGFADLAPEMMHGYADVIPEDTRYVETAESREWDWSMWRGSWGGTGASGGTQTVSINADGSLNIRNNDSGLRGISYTTRYAGRAFDAPTMHYRGLKWIGDNIDTQGNVTVGVETVRATARVHEPTIEAQKQALVDVPTLRANANAHALADVTEANVTVLAFTARAYAQAGSFREVVDVPTVRAFARAYDDQDSIEDPTGVVILRLPVAAAILTMEDK